ncbi:transcription antitermination factor NusB [Dongia sedimenti]|uniref:Transcription antitermination protein NusB n=1 Tax=Dongia sedimenti TaxID=3064282 RepID=A0ABU0YNM7_9PROT|nr:transcription antitermination factor NusB [Rhodospirillaceae bacterium R-7]
MSPKHDKAMERRAARLAAVQALYQWEQSGASADAIVKEFAEHRIGNTVDGMELPPADIRLFGNLVRGAIATADELDSMVAGVLTEDWSVERLESILRAILRGGAYELAHRTDIPPKVTISEYLAVADAFLGDKETALTNGVLDRLAHLLRPAEMEHGRGKPSAAPR